MELETQMIENLFSESDIDLTRLVENVTKFKSFNGETYTYLSTVKSSIPTVKIYRFRVLDKNKEETIISSTKISEVIYNEDDEMNELVNEDINKHINANEDTDAHVIATSSVSMDVSANNEDSFDSSFNTSSNNLNSDKPELERAKKEKYKNGKPKPRFSLIPQFALREVAHAFTYGAAKYGEHNYSKQSQMLDYIDAAQRHINQFLLGEDIDEESGNYHLSHAIASLMMVLDNQLNKTVTDNRNQAYKHS